MKKFLILVCIACLFASCKTADSVKKSPVNCKYTLVGAQTSDFSLNNITLDVAFAITNMDRSETAKMNKFEGKLYINNKEMSDLSFGSYLIGPGETVVPTTQLSLPFNKVGKNIAGLVTMNSMAINYKIAGTAYFDTAEGEFPVPVIIVPIKKD